MAPPWRSEWSELSRGEARVAGPTWGRVGALCQRTGPAMMGGWPCAPYLFSVCCGRWDAGCERGLTSRSASVRPAESCGDHLPFLSWVLAAAGRVGVAGPIRRCRGVVACPPVPQCERLCGGVHRSRGARRRLRGPVCSPAGGAIPR